MKLYANQYNAANFESDRIKKWQSQLTQAEVVDINTSIKHLNDSTNKLFLELTEIQANIVTNAVDCMNYYSAHQAKQIRKSVDDILKKTSIANFSFSSKFDKIKTFDAMLVYTEIGWHKDIFQMYTDLEGYKKTSIATVLEVLG
jgi:hypothetical protein